MKRAIFLLLVALVIGTSAEAQTIVRTDGQQITPALGTRLRRDGANVMVSIKVGQTLGEQGVQVSQIARIEFPEPAELKQTEALIGQERFDSALARIEPVFNAQSPFKDIPGNFWARAAALKATALSGVGKVAEADALLAELAKIPGNQGVGASINLALADNLARKGQDIEALKLCEKVIQDSDDPTVLTKAWITKGDIHLRKKDFDPATLAYMHVIVFSPRDKAASARAYLGAARALKGLERFDDAAARYDDLEKGYPQTPEAVTAKQELDALLKEQKEKEDTQS